MKKFVIAAIVLIIGYLAFHYYHHRNDSEIIETNEAPGNSNAGQSPSDNLISSAPANASVTILEPDNGATVSSPVVVKFGLNHMQVVPAGSNQENSGHHHLLIDMAALPDLKGPLPASDQLIHFGGGQTETTIELSPGSHSLQLLLGNYLHIPHDPPVISEKITITVE